MNITSLPIILEHTPVRIEGTSDVSGYRWTLGPTWYDEFVMDPDEGMRYPAYADTDLSGGPSDDVKAWAASAIERTTPYRVTGWDGLTPKLERRIMEMHVHTIDGRVHRQAIDYRLGQNFILKLYDADFVMVFPGETDDAATYIPVRSITTISAIRSYTPIVNV